MNRKGIAICVSLIMMLSLIVIVEISSKVQAPPTTLFVDDVPGSSGPGDPPEDYTVIQWAIENTSNGDFIFVYNGTYYENIVVDKSINLTGEGRNTTIIDGGGNENVVQITADWVGVSGFTITNSGQFNDGIEVKSFYNIISNNNISNGNGDAISLWTSNGNNTINNNIIHSNSDGIDLMLSHGNKITNNTFSDIQNGIFLIWSSDNVIKNNTMSSIDTHGIEVWDSYRNNISDNHFEGTGILIEGDLLENWNTHNIDISNTVNGKPVYFWKDTSGGMIPSGAGEVILANCNNIDIENQDLSNSSVSIILGFSSNNYITGINASSNGGYGIRSSHSSGNNITNNTIFNNRDYGIYLSASSNNNIIANNISSNGGYSIYIEYSSYVNITGNNIYNGSAQGIRLDSSSHNNIMNNNLINNSFGIDIWPSCNYNTIMNNIISFCPFEGISISSFSHNNILVNNTVSDSDNGIYFGEAANNSIESNHVFSNTGHGIYAFYYSYNNSFIDNDVYLNDAQGFYIGGTSHNNTIAGNNVSNNWCGINLSSSLNNKVYYNNVIDNTIQAHDETNNGNQWDNGYPSGGNYWSDWSPTCPDLYDGSITPQTTGSPDGICDNQYDIDVDSIDYYPLKTPFTNGALSSIINGKVVNSTMAPLEGVSVVLEYDSTQVQITVTDANGNFSFENVDPGTYTVKFNMTGYYEKNVVVEVEPSEVLNMGAIVLQQVPGDSIPPNMISDLTTSDPTSNSITLTWTAPGDDGSTGAAAGYTVKYSSTGQINESDWDSATNFSQSWTPLAAGNTESHIISGLNSGTQYWFAIKAYDEVPNYGNISNSPIGTTTPTPSTPQNLQASTGDGYIHLTWSAPTNDGGSPITNYRIYRNTTSGNLTFLTEIGNVTSYNDTGITNDITYYYKVSAKNDAGEGLLSGEVSGTPEAPPSLDEDEELPWLWIIIAIVIAVLLILVIVAFIIYRKRKIRPDEGALIPPKIPGPPPPPPS